jgi:hypothetical protein
MCFALFSCGRRFRHPSTENALPSAVCECYYNHARPHQGINQRFPVSIPGRKRRTNGPIRRQNILGCVIHDYQDSLLLRFHPTDRFFTPFRFFKPYLFLPLTPRAAPKTQLQLRCTQPAGRSTSQMPTAEAGSEPQAERQSPPSARSERHPVDLS